MAHGGTRRLVAIATAALVALTLSACAPGGSTDAAKPQETVVDLPPLSELTPIADPKNYEGATTAVVGGPSIEPLSPAPEVKLPVTVESQNRDKTKVEVTDSSRVIALSLSGTVGEMVYGLGLSDRLVGRDVSTSFAGADKLPVVTRSGHDFNEESAMALNPSLIITDGTISNEIVQSLGTEGNVTVVTVERAIDAESSYRAMQQVADALGAGSAAPELIDRLRAAITAKEAEVQAILPEESKRPRIAFLYMRGTGLFMLFGQGSGVDSLFSSIGAVDVAVEAGWEGERPLNPEALVELDPDVIVVMTHGLESAGGIEGMIAAHPSIAATNAGKHQRIIDVDDAVLFAGGTRLPDVIDGLARAVYFPDSL